MSDTRRMDPADVPDDLLDLACDQAYGAPPDPGDDRRSIARALAAVLPEFERQVREKVEEEILADVAHLFAARVGADLWEAAFHSARVARGEQ